MKKLLVITTAVVFLTFISSFMLFAGEGTKFNPGGTWYGGSYVPDHAGYKYQYTFIQTKAGHFFAMADPAYNPDTFDAAILTTWTGELVKKPDGNYEIRLIALTTTDPTDPPEELPLIWAVKGDARFDDDDTITIEYNWYAVYEWDKVPFVDDPVIWGLYAGDDPIVETIRRMPMDTVLPKPPSRPES